MLHGRAYPLSYFFLPQPGPRRRRRGRLPRRGQGAAEEAYRREGQEKPLSDQKLCELMSAQGCSSPAAPWPSTGTSCTSPAPPAASNMKRQEPSER